MQQEQLQFGQPTVLTGEGVVVKTVPVGDGDEHLVRIEGAKSPFDAPIKKHVRVDKSKDFIEWRTKRNGSTYRTIIERKQGTSRHELWLPGRRLAINLNPDDSLSEEMDAEAFVETYLRQR